VESLNSGFNIGRIIPIGVANGGQFFAAELTGAVGVKSIIKAESNSKKS